MFDLHNSPAGSRSARAGKLIPKYFNHIGSAAGIGPRPRSVTKGKRPWMTELCERIVTRYLKVSREPLPTFLPAVPRRLLVVKVFGMGDSVLIRSLIEHLI